MSTRTPGRAGIRRSSRVGRASAALAMLSTATVVLSACLYAQIPADQGSRSDPAAVTDGIDDDVMSYYTQDVSWSSCEGGFECATITAPLDWNAPGEGDIDLAIVRQRALDSQSQGALLANPGGPGASGVSFVTQGISTFGSDLQDDYDIVGWDPRGVGQSTAVTCLDGEQMDGYLYDVPEGERGSSEWTDELEAKAEEFATACDENSGGILPYITTRQSAADMDLLRGVLGQEQLNFLGFSYGTFLGATYAEMFPERVGRFVLDGAIDPSVPGSEVGVTQAIGFEDALTSFLQACVSDELGTTCPFRGNADNALDDVSTLLSTLDSRPLTGADGRKFGADAMLLAVISGLYSQDYWPYISDAFTGVLQGDTELAFLLADSYNGRVGPGTYQDNQTEAFTAYNCMDYPVESDATLDEVQEQIERDAPTIAPYWSGADPCAYWPEEPTGTRGAISAEGAAPIVVIGTTGDPATPYAWAEGLAAQLASGVLVTYEGEGHTAYGGYSSCINDAVEAYFIDDTVPEDGLVCS